MADFERSKPSNVETLIAAGAIAEGLPEEYHHVFESLSDDELAVIMLVKARLESTKRRMSDVEDYVAFLPI
jgi:hypothetical protein